MQRTILIALSLWASLVVGSASAGDDDDIDKLIQSLSSGNPVLQQSALFRLEFADETALPALPALVEVVKNSDVKNRISALKLLAGFGPLAKAAAPAIGEALQDPTVAVRIAAACALLRIVGRSDAAMAAIADALHDGEPENRREAARTMVYAGLAGIGAAQMLGEAATDADAEVRAEVAAALGAIGPEPGDRSLSLLRTLLTDKSPLVKVRAAQSLWRLDEPAEGVLPTLSSILMDFKSDANRDPIDGIPAGNAIRLLGEIGPEAKSAIPALIAKIDDPALVIRMAAIDALGAIGPEADLAIEPLAQALRDTDVHAFPFAHYADCLSDQAAVALWRIGPAARGILLAALDDKDERVRANAANALGHLPDTENKVVPALLRLLDDPDGSVRANAAYSLGRIGPGAAAADLAAHLNDEGGWNSYPQSGIDSSHMVGDYILAAMESISPEAESVLPAIVQELHKSRHMARAMREMLRRLGPAAKAAIPAIEPLLDDPDEAISAALALARIAPNHAGLLEKLRSALVDPNNLLPFEAARGLGDVGSNAKAALPELYGMLEENDHEPAIKAIVAAAIVNIDRHQEKAIVELARGLQSSSDSFELLGYDQATATWKALGANSRPAVEELIAGLKYEHPNRRGHFFWAPRWEAEFRHRSAELLIDVSASGPEVIDSLIVLCQSVDCGDRGAAADTLAKIGPPAEAGTSALVRMLADQEDYLVGGDFQGNDRTRVEPGERAVLALAQIGAPAVPALRAVLKYDELSARQLGGRPRRIEYRPRYLKDDEFVVRQRAAQALGLIGEMARPAAADLVMALKDSHRSVRAAAAEALGKIGDTDETTIAALTSTVTDKHLTVRAAAATALGRLGPPAKQAVPELSKLQDDPFELARNAAGEALRRIRSE